MKVYVAGPMRGIPSFNFPAFYRAAEILRHNGFEVVSPAEHDIEVGFNPAGMSGFEDLSHRDDFDLVESLLWDFEQVMRSDGIILLDGWKRSKGAIAERAAAEAVGTRVGELERDQAGPYIHWGAFNTTRLTVPLAMPPLVAVRV
jgi:hypothetical protein